MLLVNTDYVSGRNLQTIGIVNGWGMLAFGINLEKAAKRANAALEEEARAIGADAVINIRYSFGGSDSNCVLASGTAVKFI